MNLFKAVPFYGALIIISEIAIRSYALLFVLALLLIAWIRYEAGTVLEY